jgi:hypothetical protein
MIGFITLMPLAVCFLFKCSLPRRTTMTIAITTVATYLPYPLTIAAVGDWEEFENQKLRGVARFVGLLQETGFNQEGGPSFLEAVRTNLGQLATTYALIGSGLVAVLVLCFAGPPVLPLFTAWAGSAYALLGYLVLFGTIEENFFYFLVVPSILSTTAAVSVLLKRLVAFVVIRRVLQVGSVIVGTLFVSWSAYVWSVVHFVPDNGYEHVLAFLSEEVPPGSRIAITTKTAEPVVEEVGHLESGRWATVDELRDNRAQYVIVSTKEIFSGFSYADESFYEWLVHHGELSFRFEGRTFGRLEIYRLPPRY